MELDLIDVSFDLSATTPRELEEALGDPFAIRILPDLDNHGGEARYYLIGATVSGRHLFICFRTDGKTARVIVARDASEAETRFYERKIAEAH